MGRLLDLKSPRVRPERKGLNQDFSRALEGPRSTSMEGKEPVTQWERGYGTDPLLGGTVEHNPAARVGKPLQHGRPPRFESLIKRYFGRLAKEKPSAGKRKRIKKWVVATWVQGGHLSSKSQTNPMKKRYQMRNDLSVAIGVSEARCGFRFLQGAVGGKTKRRCSLAKKPLGEGRRDNWLCRVDPFGALSGRSRGREWRSGIIYNEKKKILGRNAGESGRCHGGSKGFRIEALD